MPDIPPVQDLSKLRLMSEKVSPQLKAWDGHSSSYKQWVERIHDHANLVNMNWRRVLDLIRTRQVRLNWSTLWVSNIDGLGPADLAFLAQDLYSFLGSVMLD